MQSLPIHGTHDPFFRDGMVLPRLMNDLGNFTDVTQLLILYRLIVQQPGSGVHGHFLLTLNDGI
jgi:hypothetical protein